MLAMVEWCVSNGGVVCTEVSNGGVVCPEVSNGGVVC